MRTLLVLALSGALAAGCPKSTGSADGVPVTIHVVDPLGEPVSTAVIRHPAEKDRHRVSTLTGLWTGDRLYLPGGQVIVFAPGLELRFEITAPGYISASVVHVVRRSENLIEVVLPELSLDDEEPEDPQIRFGRDVPLDGVPIEEAEPQGS